MTVDELLAKLTAFRDANPHAGALEIDVDAGDLGPAAATEVEIYNAGSRRRPQRRIRISSC